MWLEVLLGVLLALIVVSALYLRFGCEKPKPGDERR